MLDGRDGWQIRHQRGFYHTIPKVMQVSINIFYYRTLVFVSGYIYNNTHNTFMTYHRERIPVVCRPQRHPDCPRSHHTQFHTSLQCRLLLCLSKVHFCHSSGHHWRFLPGSTHNRPQPVTAGHHQSIQLEERVKGMAELSNK